MSQFYNEITSNRVSHFSIWLSSKWLLRNKMYPEEIALPPFPSFANSFKGMYPGSYVQTCFVQTGLNAYPCLRQKCMLFKKYFRTSSMKILSVSYTEVDPKNVPKLTYFLIYCLTCICRIMERTLFRAASSSLRTSWTNTSAKTWSIRGRLLLFVPRARGLFLIDEEKDTKSAFQ